MSRTAATIGLLSWLVLCASCRIDPEAFSEAFDEKSVSFEWKEADSRLLFRANGELSISETGTAFFISSPQGEVLLEEEKGGQVRRLEIEKREDGESLQSYFVNGASAPFDQEAEKWLSEVSLRLARETGLGVPRRVKYLLSSGGVDQVLEEIALIRSGSVKRLYVEQLVDSTSLSADQVRRLALLAAEIGSGTEMTRTLFPLIEQHPEDAALTGALITAAGAVSSSSGKRQVVEALLETRKLSPEALARCATAVQGIRSSSEKSAVLGKLSEAGSNSAESLIAILEAAGTIRSSFEKRLAVEKVLERKGLTAPVYVSGIEVIRGINSSSERSRALNQLLDVLPAENDEVVLAFLEAAGSLPATSDRFSLLSRLVVKDLSVSAQEVVREWVAAETLDEAARRDLLRKLER